MAKKTRRTRLILNIIMLVLVAVLLYFAWPDIVTAWGLLGTVNIWILLLLLPAQVLSYYANGMTIFTYLRGRGQLKETKIPEVTSISLELNFMNHIFPSGGFSGVAYMIWRLGKMGVSASQGTMAQIVRFLVTMGAFIVCLAVSLIIVTIENQASNWIVMLSTFTVTGIVLGVLFAGYLVGSESRIVSFAKWLSRTSNNFVRKITFGRVHKKVLPKDKAVKFFTELYEDFQVIKAQKKLLLKPVLWGFAFVLADVSLFAIAFWALGASFNPALLVIAYGAASIIGAFMVTPGGAGGYEATMVTVLAAGGMTAASASAGVLLARVILIICTLLTGYAVYHRAMKHFGKPKLDNEMAVIAIDSVRDKK
jgi:uncharacterized protein (TIRG00374 family)